MLANGLCWISILHSSTNIFKLEVRLVCKLRTQCELKAQGLTTVNSTFLLAATFN